METVERTLPYVHDNLLGKVGRSHIVAKSLESCEWKGILPTQR
jgi:hypothetical protein